MLKSLQLIVFKEDKKILLFYLELEVIKIKELDF